MILHADDNYAYTDAGSFVVGYKMLLPEIYSMEEQRINEALRQLRDMVKRLPVQAFVQRLDCVVPYTFTGEQLPKETFLQKSYAKHVSGREGYKMHSYLFFSTGGRFNSFLKSLRNPLSLSADKAIQADNFIDYDFLSIVHQEVNTLNKSKIFSAIPLSKEDMLYFNFLYFNLFEERWSTQADLHSKKKVRNTPIGIEVGDHMVGCFSIFHEKQLPNELPQLISDKLLQNQNKDFNIGLGDTFGIYLRCPHYVSTIICRNNLEQWKTTMKDTATQYYRLALGGQNGFSRRGKEIDNLIASLDGEYNDTLIVQANTNIIFWANQEDKFLSAKNDISSYLNEKGVLPEYTVGKHLRNLFFSTNPFCMSSNNNATMYPNTLEIATSFIPIFGGYKEDAEGCYFCDRFNIPIKVDLWDRHKKHIKARNFMMIAPTGEGKSFLLMEFLRQMEESGVVLVIIDLGKSFRRYAKLLDHKAVFIEYDNDKPLGINPFNVPIEELRQTDKLNSLSEFVYAHLNVEEDMKEIDKVILTSFLREYIDQSKHPSFPDFVSFVLTNEQRLKRKYADKLEFFDFNKMKVFLGEFVGEGRYAFLYKTTTTTNNVADNLKNKKVVIFEIDKAQNDYKVLSVLLQSIKDTIYTNIWTDKTKRGIILFEEFAKILGLQNGAILKQVEFYYQAIRKQEGSIGIVLQNVSQIPENSTAQSIFGNSHITFALTHGKKDIDLFLRRMIKEEDAIQRNQMLSLKSNFDGTNKYSEVFIRRGENSNIFRLDVSRDQFLAYITDGAESTKIDQLIHSGLSVEDAINQLK